MKKTLKIFINSFIVSLFAIWIANELLLVEPKNTQDKFEIPDKNITLFLQDDVGAISPHSSTPIKALALPFMPKKNRGTDNIDPELFMWDDTYSTVKGIKISSIDEVADIPLEYSGKKTTKKNIAVIEKKPTQNETFDSEDVKSVHPEAKDNILNTANSQIVYQPEENAESSVSSKDYKLEDAFEVAYANSNISNLDDEPVNTIDKPQQEAKEDNNIEEFALIPLEQGVANPESGKIKIADKVPTGQIAMVPTQLPVESLDVKNLDNTEDSAEKPWKQMSSLTENDNPWVVAKGMKYPKNSQVNEEVFYNSLSDSEIEAALQPEQIEQEGEVKVAEMVKNILIPIPEEILNDKNLTPQLVSSKKQAQINEGGLDDEDKSGKNPGLFKSIASIFSSSQTNDDLEEISEESSVSESPKEKKKGLFAAFSKDKAPSGKILPAEMKLSFQPGRAEISGQTLKWIEAFAVTALEDSSVFLEIRIDRTSSFELQQKRLNLLHNILTNKGVGYHQINTVFTSREPNSFIIRTLRINDNVNNNTPKSNNRQSLNYQSW